MLNLALSNAKSPLACLLFVSLPGRPETGYLDTMDWWHVEIGKTFILPACGWWAARSDLSAWLTSPAVAQGRAPTHDDGKATTEGK